MSSCVELFHPEAEPLSSRKEGTIPVVDGSTRTATFVGWLTFRAGWCEHDPNEANKPASGPRAAKPERCRGPFLCGRRSNCSGSAGRDRTFEPSSCEEGRARQSASRPV